MKKIAAVIAVMTVAIVFKDLGLDPKTYVSGALSIFIMVEAYSIMQNYYAIRTGVILPEYDVISMLIKAFMDFLRRKIEKIVKVTIEEESKKEK